MIVIFADSTDVHADAVEKDARSRGSEIGRLNRDETHRWDFNFLCGEPILNLDGRVFTADKIRSVFVRGLPDKQSFPQLSINASSEVHDYVATQRLGLINDCIALLSERTRVINTYAPYIAHSPKHPNFSWLIKSGYAHHKPILVRIKHLLVNT